MNEHFLQTILQTTGAKEILANQVIQSLWSGYGEIVRVELQGGIHSSVVAKHVRLPKQSKHPRGWNTDISHQRKIKSYQVEMAWYQQWSSYCNESCRVPKFLAFTTHEDEFLMVLEDLDSVGFAERRSAVTNLEMQGCLSWLANFHATFMGKQPENLWTLGTYWYLDTRPDELSALNDPALKAAAQAIDQKLRDSPFQTFVHGDAKLANFCFSEHGEKVAAVDFQYVGGGCGMKDVAYFIGSCLDENECQQWESRILDFYFRELKKALKSQPNAVDAIALERDWRALYPVAWTDFHRFIKGWSPGHWKINGYSERLAREVLAQLENQVKSSV